VGRLETHQQSAASVDPATLAHHGDSMPILHGVVVTSDAAVNDTTKGAVVDDERTARCKFKVIPGACHTLVDKHRHGIVDVVHHRLHPAKQTTKRVRHSQW
jgi:hypothetical protein